MFILEANKKSLPHNAHCHMASINLFFCMCCVSTWTVEIIVSVVAVELLNKGAWYVSTNKPNPGANRCDRYDGYFPVLITQVTPTLLQNSFQTAELKSSISLALQYIRHLSVVKSKLPAVQL